MGNNKSILVIDDSPTVRRLAELVLSQEGYNVFTAEDGDSGLRMAKDEVPSLIIVDFIMPKMNGYQFCKSIRSDSILNDIPIVLITSKGGEVGKGFDDKFGIVQYLQKPFEAETLTATVKEVLSERGKSSVADVQETVKEVLLEKGKSSGAEVQEAVNMNKSSSEMSFVDITPGEYKNIENAMTASSREMPEPLYAQVDNHPGNGDSSDSPLSAEQPESPHLQDVLQSNSSFIDVSSDKPFKPKKAAISENIPVTHSAGENTIETPANTPPAGNGDNQPGNAPIHENISKEFRHYFGRELTMLLKSTMIQTLKETDLVRSSRRILAGELMYISVPDLIQFIGNTRLSGKLSILSDNFNSEIFFESGQVAFASISKPSHRTSLEELLLQDGKCPQSELHTALSGSGGSCFTAGNNLIEKGLLTEDELADYYRRLSEDALQNTLEATSGHFYVEDIPIPSEIRGFSSKAQLNNSYI